MSRYTGSLKDIATPEQMERISKLPFHQLSVKAAVEAIMRIISV